MDTEDNDIKMKIKSTEKKNSVTILNKNCELLQWATNITIIDLSNKNLSSLEDSVVFPPKLVDLNLSHNNLNDVPGTVLNLSTLKCLDISYNIIRYFDDTPSFCHCIEKLNVSHNALRSPPYWIWTEKPAQLNIVDLSYNSYITTALENSINFEDLLQYSSPITQIKVQNCHIRHEHTQLLNTFPKLKVLEFGTPDYTRLSSNCLSHVPCKGLDQCCDLERLILCNIQLYNIDSNIDMYKNLIEINLSQNCLRSIPNEIGNLENLEICVLSCNNILYLPETIVNLKKLICLRLDSNNLCMMPENLDRLEKLKVLDLYDNEVYDVPETEILAHIEELDLAQNYFEEPDSTEYVEKKEKIRLNIDRRLDGKKKEADKPESEYTPKSSEDEELLNYMNNSDPDEIFRNNENLSTIRPPSSPEDWDSDDYWVPCYYRRETLSQSPWLSFVQQKMRLGNFCPMDMHVVPIADKVKHEKMCNPKVWREVEGQFDDYSDDS